MTRSYYLHSNARVATDVNRISGDVIHAANTATRVAAGGGKVGRFVPDMAVTKHSPVPAVGKAPANQGWRLTGEDRGEPIPLGGSLTIAAFLQPDAPIVGDITLTAIVYLIEGGKAREVTRDARMIRVVSAGTGALTYGLITPPYDDAMLDGDDALQLEMYVSSTAALPANFALYLDTPDKLAELNFHLPG